MKWTVFDFEFTELLNSQDDLQDTLHISCASVLSTDEAWPSVWYEKPVHGTEPGDYMTESTLSAFIDLLQEKCMLGYRIATWGGSATDWRILAKECPSRSAFIRAMALDSVDVPMCACMSIGTMMGLNAACNALGLSLKDSEASMFMPELWNSKDNRAESREKVLQHVSNDSYATLLVIKHAETSRTLPWISKKGHYKVWSDVTFWSVRTCLQMELPKVPFEIAPTQNAKRMARWLLLE
jgi:hypothetical protein